MEDSSLRVLSFQKREREKKKERERPLLNPFLLVRDKKRSYGFQDRRKKVLLKVLRRKIFAGKNDQIAISKVTALKTGREKEKRRGGRDSSKTFADAGRRGRTWRMREKRKKKKKKGSETVCEMAYAMREQPGTNGI